MTTMDTTILHAYTYLLRYQLLEFHTYKIRDLNTIHATPKF